MAQPIAPEIWQKGISDNRLLPGRYTTGLFVGNTGVQNIANNPQACRVYDIVVSDYITDYDDRRINGHAGTNTEGRDGWGASAYGVFQDVHFDTHIYTMSRHRSMAMRVFDEVQYYGANGKWGTASESYAMSDGQALMKTAEKLNEAKSLWEQSVLGPDIDRYTIFAVCNGHMCGRLVGKVEGGVDYNDQIFDGNPDHYEWIAQPGMMQDQPIAPRFAPIHCIDWDDENVPLLLSTIKVAWNNLFIPQDNRVILIDPAYEYRLLMALTGSGVPATDSAYSDLQNGSFTRLMGWEFNFEIPSEYYPQLYVDANNNVVHSADGTAAYDSIINSVAADSTKSKHYNLTRQLIEADRMNRFNFVRTVWNAESGKFENIVTNYPLGMPSAAPYYGEAKQLYKGDELHTVFSAEDIDYPFVQEGAGYGLYPKGKGTEGAQATGPVGDIKKRQVIGIALYRKAAQLSQEYSEMQTDEGKTRGKFTEMVFDVKYDAWVIDNLSAGIMPILETTADESTLTFAIPVKNVSTAAAGASETTGE